MSTSWKHPSPRFACEPVPPCRMWVASPLWSSCRWRLLLIASKLMTRWWFQIDVHGSPIFGEDVQFDWNILKPPTRWLFDLRRTYLIYPQKIDSTRDDIRVGINSKIQKIFYSRKILRVLQGKLFVSKHSDFFGTSLAIPTRCFGSRGWWLGVCGVRYAKAALG